MPSLRQIIDEGLDLHAGGPGSGCNPDAGQCGRKPGSGSGGGQTESNVRVPTGKELAHERSRVYKMGQNGTAKLMSRLRKITNVQKAYAFALALENDNFHDVAKQAYAKARALGWNGQHPKGRLDW